MELAPRLTSILRRPGVLSAIVSARNPEFEAGDRETPPYHDVTIALGDVPESICPWRDRDLKAWRAVRAVPSINQRAATAIVRTLIGSVVSPDAGIAHLDDLDFRTSVNLQPYLCTPDGEQAILLLIADTVALATRDTELPEWHLSHRQQIATLPVEFRRRFLWSLHLAPWAHVEQTLEVYHRLDLETSPAVRSAIARMLTLTDRVTGLQWCRAIAEIDPARRTESVHAIIESGALQEPPARVAETTR